MFGNSKSSSSFHIIVYTEIEKDACGDLQLQTSFDLIKYVFADIGGPYDAKAPLSAHVKCSCGEWMSLMNVVMHMMGAFTHMKKMEVFSFGFTYLCLRRVEVLSF